MWHVKILLLLSTCLVFGCKNKTSPDASSFDYGSVQGVLINPDIDEASGLVASHTNPGMLWTHNDSGDKARIFLLDSLGRHRATVWLKGTVNRDWEDIAVGPGPERDKTYVYVGDVGDNLAKYEYKFIYRFLEPVIPTKDTTVELEQVDSIKFKLPDGTRDCEALMIDPATKDLYIFSKREAAVNLYRLPYPQSTTESMIAEKVLESLPFTLIVAADWSADGKEILIKDYEQVYYWRRSNNEPIAELLKTQPILLPYHQETQGESIAFDYYGKGYYTLSEEAQGVKPTLMFYKRLVNKIN